MRIASQRRCSPRWAIIGGRSLRCPNVCCHDELNAMTGPNLDSLEQMTFAAEPDHGPSRTGSRDSSFQPSAVRTFVLLAATFALSFSSVVPACEESFSAPTDQSFTSEVDQTVQRYVELRPLKWNSKEPCDVLIALHGHGSDRWQYIREPRGECRGVREVASENGMLFISPDYRASTSWMGPVAEADLSQLIRILRKKYNVRHLFLAGGSMGGTSALIFAALHPEEISGVLAENATANMIEYAGFQDAIAASYGGSKQEKLDEYRRRSAELHADKLTMPIAFTVGGEDRVVPPDSVRRLAESLQQLDASRILIIDDPQGGHATNLEDTVRAMRFLVQKVDLTSPSPEH